MLKNLMLTTVVCLVLAPAASAGHDDYRYAPDPDIAVLAHELENAARHVHHEAEDRLRGYHWAEQDAIRALHRLEQRAEHFHGSVERYNASPRHIERDFYRLRDAYEAAAHSVHYVRSPHVRRDFRHVERLMGRLNAAVEACFRPRRPVYDDRPHGAVILDGRRGSWGYDVRVRW